jgi:hypothetical protein
LLSLLSPTVAGFREFLNEQQALAKAAGLSLTPSKIASIDSEPNRDLATIMLGQFCTAYQLAADPNLAAAFDKPAAALLDPKGAQQVGSGPPRSNGRCDSNSTRFGALIEMQAGTSPAMTAE